MAKDKTTKEKLVCIESKLDMLIEGFNNHLEHHRRLYDKLFRLFLVVLGIVGTAVVSVILTLIFKS